jgi:imidazolonepropionase
MARPTASSRTAPWRSGRTHRLGRPGRRLPGARPGRRLQDLGGGWSRRPDRLPHPHRHGGNRAREFELRLEGASYEEIARAGGGIVSTVRATRAAGEDALSPAPCPRLDALIAEGVTVEVKSGYGLDRDTELRMLRTARRIAETRRCASAPASSAPMPCRRRRRRRHLHRHRLHPRPGEGRRRRGAGRCRRRLLRGHRLLPRPDRPGLRRRARPRPAGEAARRAALEPRRRGARRPLRRALRRPSGIQLEEGVAAMAAAGTVAVILPGAFYTLRETQAPPIAAPARPACRWRSPPTATPAPRR